MAHREDADLRVGLARCASSVELVRAGTANSMFDCPPHTKTSPKTTSLSVAFSPGTVETIDSV